MPVRKRLISPISASPMSGICQQAQILIRKILNVWMPVPIKYLSGWLIRLYRLSWTWKNYLIFGRALNHDKDHIIFVVIDNGIGMDKETKKKIFTLFFSSKGSKGTGLGLFISNNIIKQHGGEIKIRSTLGEGTKFIIKIPKIIPESAKTPYNKKK